MALCRFVLLGRKVTGEDRYVFVVADVHVVSHLLSEHLSAPEVPFTL